VFVSNVLWNGARMVVHCTDVWDTGVASTDSSRILKLDSDSGAARVDGRASDPTVAICVSVKGENAGDLAEWAQYYRCQPFYLSTAWCSGRNSALITTILCCIT
jgi:hypothetical protein